MSPSRLELAVKRLLAATLASTSLVLVCQFTAQAQSPISKEALVTNHASGPFDVKVTPQDDKSEDPLLARMTVDKQ